MNTPTIRRRKKSTTPMNGTSALDHAANLHAASVIDTVGHTQQVPVTVAGSGRPETDSGADTSEHGALTSAEWPVPDASGAHLEVAGKVSMQAASEVAASPATPVSNKSLVTAELVSGLRTASRHLSRPSASEGHLRTELTIQARRIDSLVRSQEAHDEGWAIAAMSLVHDASCALDQRRVTDGWQLLRAAQAEMLDGLDHRSLAVERANITGADLVVDDSVDTDQLRSEVWAMRQTKNTYRAELERRLFEAARGLFHRAVTLLGVIVLGAIGVLVAAPAADSADALGGITAYLTIVGLGMTGAAVSHVLFTNSSKRASAISEVANPLQIVMLRLVFGGVAGLLVVMLLQSDIQNLVNVTAISAYPWAILGGFAERYVDRVIDHVETDAHAAAAEACRAGVL